MLRDGMVFHANPHLHNLPEQYEQALYWKLSEHHKLLVALNVAGILMMILALLPLVAWARLWQPVGAVDMSAIQTILGLVMVGLTVVLHELLHGLALRCYGAKPTYGVLWKGMMFYATAAGHAFARNAYVVIALAPLIGLSMLGIVLLMLPQPGWLAIWVILCTAFNAGSAVGDLWLVRVALGYPRFAYVVDEKDGLRVFLPPAS